MVMACSDGGVREELGVHAAVAGGAAPRVRNLSMATVSLGANFAEAYVMRSLHKEKMKKMKEMEKRQQEAKGDDKLFDERKIPAATGCFPFWVSKKTPSAKVASDSATGKPV
ncbi:hypothetical protein Goari_009490 [Gossypium aridum]|uniref:Uncharacterized protein n=1 Tax=Gossypium aridum TaxID=34290 RepID=A0A7J8XYS3_GOSAI|nr:hypothetical protein [Gossypium aridum]